MAKILVQRTHDPRLTRLEPRLEATFETLVVPDRELSGAIERHRRGIGGFVLFHLTDGARRACALITQERFNAPTTPIAHLGSASERAELPYGARHFGEALDEEAIEYLSRARHVRVLVVEDDEGIRDVLAMSLSKHFAVDTAADGEEALRCLDAETRYDIIVLDIMLPKVSGEEVFAHARAAHPNTPILVITAYDTEERAIQFAFRGADGYIAKPFASNAAFREKLVETLRAHHEREIESERTVQRDTVDRAWATYQARMRAYT